MELYLSEQLGKITYEVDDTPVSDSVLILAHGAGAGMYHPFIVSLAQSICDHGVSVVRFNFPYMEKGRKAPGSPRDAIYCWREMFKEVKKLFHGKRIFLAGKSYGGRMASHLLADDPELSVSGIIYFGFPLHAPGRDSKDRADHLDKVKVPQFFIQGTKDKLANIEMINEVIATLNDAEILEIESGDHSFKTPKSVASPAEIMGLLSGKASEWIQKNA